MTDVLSLARPELRSLQPYVAGAYEPGTIRLNANESPWRAPGDRTKRGLNLYPPPRPWDLRRRLAQYYAIAEDQLLVTRGSSEAIDVLIRGFCRAYKDRLVVCPPTFDMYRVYGTIQGAEVLRVSLLRSSEEGRDFALDTEGIIAALDGKTKIVFICSPNNPTGASMNPADVEAICEAAAGRSLIVIDEAYQEFSAAPGFRSLRDRFEHVVILRTLSKFVSLAGVRCGSVIASTRLIEFLGTVLPPYTFPTPSIEHVLEALTVDSLEVAEKRAAVLRAERARMSEALRAIPQVIKVWPSDANFILIEADDAGALTQSVRRANILLRTFDAEPALANCIRITVGRPEDNDRLLDALSAAESSDG